MLLREKSVTLPRIIPIRMKKTHILLLAALICGTAKADDNNTFYFTDAIIMPGETASIELCMRNTATDLTCLEAEIQLPEGLTIVCNEKGEPSATLYRNRTASHEFLSNVLDNGNLKLLVSSINGNLVSGKEGPLLNFHVQASETAPIGECSIETVGESLLVNSKAAAYYSVGVKGKVLITDDPTNIEHLPLTIDHSEPIYNLAGQRVSKAKNGIFIRGGKKELHK